MKFQLNVNGIHRVPAEKTIKHSEANKVDTKLYLYLLTRHFFSFRCPAGGRMRNNKRYAPGNKTFRFPQWLSINHLLALIFPILTVPFLGVSAKNFYAPFAPFLSFHSYLIAGRFFSTPSCASQIGDGDAWWLLWRGWRRPVVVFLFAMKKREETVSIFSPRFKGTPIFGWFGWPFSRSLSLSLSLFCTACSPSFPSVVWQKRYRP